MGFITVLQHKEIWVSIMIWSSIFLDSISNSIDIQTCNDTLGNVAIISYIAMYICFIFQIFVWIFRVTIIVLEYGLF